MDKNQQQEIKKLATDTEGLDVFRDAVDLKTEKFQDELTRLINRHGMDALYGVSDFVLSGYMVACARVLSVTHEAQNKLSELKM